MRVMEEAVMEERQKGKQRGENGMTILSSYSYHWVKVQEDWMPDSMSFCS